MTLSTSRRNFLKISGGALGAASLPFLKVLPAQAASDLHRKGTNRASYQIAVNCYDRLVSFGTKEAPGGGLSYDYTKIEPELAESWSISDDGLKLTFKIKSDATFWDGTKVTAADVKWSFDRAVSVGGFPSVQMKAGGLVKPEQFEAIDDETFVITLEKASKLTLPDLAVPVPFVINSKVAKANATEKDPWATDYLHNTPAGSGAFKVIKWNPGEQLVNAMTTGSVGHFPRSNAS